MTDFPWGQLITAVSTLAAGLGSTILVNRFNRDKHKRDRTWEKRTEAMSEMLQAIHRARMKFQSAKRNYDEDAVRAHSSDDVAAIEAASYAELRKADTAYRANFLFFSPAYVAMYEKHQDDYEAIDGHTLSPPEIVDAVVEHLDIVFDDLSRQAQRDAR